MKDSQETLAFLDAAKAWETDQVMRAQRSERRAWWVRGLASPSRWLQSPPSHC